MSHHKNLGSQPRTRVTNTQTPHHTSGSVERRCFGSPTKPGWQATDWSMRKCATSALSRRSIFDTRDRRHTRFYDRGGPLESRRHRPPPVESQGTKQAPNKRAAAATRLERAWEPVKHGRVIQRRALPEQVAEEALHLALKEEQASKTKDKPKQPIQNDERSSSSSCASAVASDTIQLRRSSDRRSARVLR